MALRLTLLASALAVAHAALAESIGDPTRPPAALQRDDNSVEEAAQSQLQSVLLAPGRKVAVINGQTVALGGRIGDAVVSDISESGVTLLRGSERTRLELLPGIEKKPGGANARRHGQSGEKP